MSIKGIDNQIMVHRVTDYARDASVQNKRDEFAQLMQSHLGKVQQEQQKHQVQQVAIGPKVEKLRDQEQRQNKQQHPRKKKKDSGGHNKSAKHVDILI